MKISIAMIALLFVLPLQARTITPNYVYAEKQMADVNWMYIGYAPRAESGDQLNVTISKKGHTLRAELALDTDALAEYPEYLIRRRKEVMQVIERNELSILQAQRLTAYNQAIDRVEADFAKQKKEADRAAYGLKLLRENFPDSVDGDEKSARIQFVYPITTHKDGEVPAAQDYQPYAVDERRSEYTLADQGAEQQEGEPWNAHIFGGFPAIWLDPDGHGVGVHGPIRFSEADDERRDGQSGTMEDFWEENNFLNEATNPIEGLNPTFRWDVVRTSQSKGCFRAETMELRHLLPADFSDIKRVNFKVVDDYDRIVTAENQKGLIVNVDYYVENPYSKPNKKKWLRKYLVPDGEDVDEWMEANARTFPYLSPMTLEFVTPSGTAALEVMSKLNRID